MERICLDPGIYDIKCSIRPLIPLYRQTLRSGANEALRVSLHDILVEKYRKILHILETTESSEREKEDVMEQLRFMAA